MTPEEYNEKRLKFIEFLKQGREEQTELEKRRQDFLNEFRKIKQNGEPFDMTVLKRKHGLQLLDEDREGNKVIPNLNPNHRLHTLEEYQALKDYIEKHEAELAEDIDLSEVTAQFDDETKTFFVVKEDDL